MRRSRWCMGVLRLLAYAAVASPGGVLAGSGAEAQTVDASPGRTAADSGQVDATVPGRVPILLVPGWSDGAGTLAPLEALLEESGWPGDSLERVEFEDPVGSNVEHARELAEALHRLRERTGAPRVDVVAHSMGGLATRYFLQNGGSDAVRRVVFVATPHRGTLTAYLAWGEGGKEMHPGSMFLMDLQEFRSVPSGIEALTLRTKVDFHILPPESATLVGVPDVEVCCPTHEGLLSHPEAFEAMRRFLTRGDVPSAMRAAPDGVGGSGDYQDAPAGATP